MDAPECDAIPFRGRLAELDLIRECLRRTSDGCGSVVLVEGGRGLGKSRLLRESHAAADAVGVRVVDLNGRAPADQQARDLETLLEQEASTTPVLAVLDDAHSADPGLAAALSVLPSRLQQRPIVWLIAFREANSAPALTDVVAHLRERGARTLSLQPLDAGDVTRLVVDLVGAEPATDLLAQAEHAGGNPGLVTELMRGALEDDLVRFDQGQAGLREARPPQRLCNRVRDDLGRVSAAARSAAVVASVLGPFTSFELLAAMLDATPASLLVVVDELERAELLVSTGHDIAFGNELVREAVVNSVSRSVRRALQRQAIGVLIDAGASPLDLARPLAASADPGDRATIATLMAASRSLRGSNAEAAADLGRHAVDLTAIGDERRPGLIADTARLLHAAGRTREAEQLASDAFRECLSPEVEADIRLSVARMGDLEPERRSEASRLALQIPELGPRLQARHSAILAVNVLLEGRLDAGRELLVQAETATAAGNDAFAALALDAGRIRITYMEERFAHALQSFDTTSLRAREDDDETQVPGLLRAELLLTTDEFDAALALASDRIAVAEQRRRWSDVRAWQRVRGRCLLQAGQVAEADAVLDETFTTTVAADVATVSDVATLVALSRMSIAAGDQRRARSLAILAEGIWDDETRPPELRRHAAWMLALDALAGGDAVRARDRLAGLGEDASASMLPTLMVDTADLALLARIARDAGDDALAQSTRAVADARLRKNPEITSIAGTAAHVRGILDSSTATLAEACELLAHAPRRLAHASALEDYGIALVRDGDQPAGIDALGSALENYSSCGAAWDASRVRLRLRELGVRRRLVKAVRPDTGWDGLTDAEVSVVRLVAEGLTNREVAERLFVSPHTVSMHLRHVFTKLGVNSRVELTRLAFEQDLAA